MLVKVRTFWRASFEIDILVLDVWKSSVLAKLKAPGDDFGRRVLIRIAREDSEWLLNQGYLNHFLSALFTFKKLFKMCMEESLTLL